MDFFVTGKKIFKFPSSDTVHTLLLYQLESWARNRLFLDHSDLIVCLFGFLLKQVLISSIFYAESWSLQCALGYFGERFMTAINISSSSSETGFVFNWQHRTEVQLLTISRGQILMIKPWCYPGNILKTQVQNL